MQFGFSYTGLLWLIMLFVPNLIWTKNKPQDYEKYSKNENKILLAFERTGEFIVTPSALIFSSFNIKQISFWSVVLLFAFICMVLYEISWIRYFRSQKTMKDFYSPLLGVPVAGATYPVISFFLLGIYGGNIIMLLGSVILGIGHIGIHLAHRNEVTERKPKKKLPVRIILGILKGIGCIILIVVAGFFIFAITGRNINEIKYAFKYKDGVNEGIYVQLNDQEEYVLLMGEKKTNPVIISLHGGPGSPSTYVDYVFFDDLTDDYTVACWDERGCGRSYYRNSKKEPDNRRLSINQQLEDLDELVDYLRERFGQEKVIIMGHSYGTVLGTQYSLAHPDKVSAYIGIGQVVNERGFFGDIFAYEDALEKAREMGDDTTELEQAFNDFFANTSTPNLMALRQKTQKYHQAEVKKNLTLLSAITSPYIGVDDVRWYLLELAVISGNSKYVELQAPLMVEISMFDAGEKDKFYQIPVLFLSGSDDWVCPVGLIQEYSEVIRAPYKDMYLVQGCGHSPQLQLSEDTANAVRDFLKKAEV